MRIQFKICRKCKETKSTTEFAEKKVWCRTCVNTWLKTWYIANKAKHVTNTAKRCKERIAERRKQLRAYLASSSGCVDCGERDPLVLQFDHVRGTKIDAVSNLVGRGASWKRINDEIAKCDIRCANCHLRKTAKERGYYGM